MERNDILLGVAALVLVGFSLFVSLLVPRWRPEFPGRGLRFFAVVCALLVLGMLTAVEVFGEEGEEVHSAKVEEEKADTGGVDTGATSTAATETEAGGSGSGATEGDPAAGKELFAANGCGGCHTLEDAGSTGTQGPNLDSLQPSYDAAVAQITNGGGGMPAFGDQLSEEEIQNLAAYVVEATGG